MPATVIPSFSQFAGRYVKNAVMDFRSLTTRLSRIGRYVAPSFCAGICAVTLVAVVETTMGLGHIDIDSTAVAAAIATILSVSVVGMDLLRRGCVSWLRKAWKKKSGALNTMEVTSWASYLFIATVVQVTAGVFMLERLQKMTPARPVVAVVGAVSLCGIALGLVVLSPLGKKGVAIFLKKYVHAFGKDKGLGAIGCVFAVVVIGAISFAVWQNILMPRLGRFWSPWLPWFILASVIGFFLSHWLTGFAHNTKARRGRGLPVILSGATLLCIGNAALVLLLSVPTQNTSWLHVWRGSDSVGDWVSYFRPLSQLNNAAVVPPLKKTAEKERNILLISIDTVRSDMLSVYGGEVVMPSLVKFADRSVVFENTFSSGNVTRRALPSLATGLHPKRIAGRKKGWGFRFDPRHISIAERLRATGYSTAGFICCRSFIGEKAPGLEKGMDHLVVDKQGSELAKQFVAWLREKKKDTKPWHAWIHVIEPHNWKRSAGSQRDQITTEYQRLLAVTDSILGTILDGITDEADWDNTVVVIVSDHGEELGEAGHYGHATSLKNTQIRIPLLIAAPGVSAGRADVVSGLVDVVPTMLELANLSPLEFPVLDGASLRPWMGAKDGVQPGQKLMPSAFSFMIPDSVNPYSRTALIQGSYKLIVDHNTGQQSLYHYKNDPKEETNLLQKRRSIVLSMKKYLKEKQETFTIPPW